MRVMTVMVALLTLLSLPARASSLTIGELINHPANHDGQIVTLTAEVVGDVMVRGEVGWINIHDGSGSLGVYAPKDLIIQLVPGRYGRKGDTIALVGAFSRSCSEHGGDMDIHAISLVVVQPHEYLTQDVDIKRFVLAAVLALVFAALWVERLSLRRKEDRPKANGTIRS